jgi:type II secretory pathway pseudopilin PulG
MRAGSQLRVRARIQRGFSLQRGFTYLSLLLIVAAMGTGMAAFGELASHAAQREKEAELLFVGDAYREAIRQYYESSPAGHKRYPTTLEQLLKDDRFAFTRRYLRRLYRDPLTGKDMATVEAPEGGIMGVHSASQAAPAKSGNFPLGYEVFEGAAHYADWQFVHSPLPAASASK